MNSYITNLDNYEISIYNANGLLLNKLTKSLNIGNNIFELPIIEKIPGMYFVTFTGGNQKTTQKFIIQ